MEKKDKNKSNSKKVNLIVLSLFILSLLILNSILFLIDEKQISKEENIKDKREEYQGPVTLKTDIEYFRRFGVTKEIIE